MTFDTFILIVFILVSLLILGVLVLLIRQIKKDGRLPPEKLTTLAAVLFLPVIIIIALVFKGLMDWRSEITFEKKRIEVEQFVVTAYKPLAESQQLLLTSLSKMSSLLRETEELETAFPSHFQLIQKVDKQRRLAQLALYKIHKESDKEIRHAWISHKTMDSSDVLAKFSKQAVQLDSSIKNAMKENEAQLYGTQDDLIRDLDAARKLLDSIRRPEKSKKQKLKNIETLNSIKHFSDRTKDTLINFLGRIDTRLKDEIETLQELIRISGQQMAKVRSYLLKNQDLEQPLSKVISDWKDLEQSSKSHLHQILFAAESEYIALTLGVKENDPAVKAMHKSLKIILPKVVGIALKKRDRINQSYSFKRAN